MLNLCEPSNVNFKKPCKKPKITSLKCSGGVHIEDGDADAIFLEKIPADMFQVRFRDEGLGFELLD